MTARSSLSWTRRDGAEADPQRSPQLLRDVLAHQGDRLPAADRREAAGRFGHDFGRVRIHHDTAAAAAAAAALGARAFAAGQHIVFGAREYAPHSGQGHQVLLHELAHVAQQERGISAPGSRLGEFTLADANGEEEIHAGRAGSRPHQGHPEEIRPRRSGTALKPILIQRLIREPYPWIGVITPAVGANVRSSPDLSDPLNVQFAIPRGAQVKVLSTTSNWLKIETRYRGPAEMGYVHHTLVDDASASSMAGSVGTTMVWRGSGPGSGTDFEAWASAATETPLPAITPTTVMNCWEAVLVAAYQARTITWSWIHNLYTSVPVASWVTAMSRGPLHAYAVPGPNPRMPQRGDLVFFNGLEHVAMATGNGSDVYTFWPPPNTPFRFGGTTDKVKVFTIEDLVAWWSANMPPPSPVVQFGAPRW